MGVLNQGERARERERETLTDTQANDGRNETVPLSITIRSVTKYYYNRQAVDGSDTGIPLTLAKTQKHDKGEPLPEALGLSTK